MQKLIFFCFIEMRKKVGYSHKKNIILFLFADILLRLFVFVYEYIPGLRWGII